MASLAEAAAASDETLDVMKARHKTELKDMQYHCRQRMKVSNLCYYLCFAKHGNILSGGETDQGKRAGWGYRRSHC